MSDITSEIRLKGQPTIIGGIMITAGAAVGAGLFSLPTASSGMWFGWSVFCMLLSWFCMYHASVLILEVNLHFREGASFDTLVKETLGKKLNIINGLMLAFLLYILEYAFISGGGSLVNHIIMATFDYAPSQIISGLVFAFALSFIVWLSIKAVDRVVSVLFMGMVVTFFMTVGDLNLNIELKNLFPDPVANDQIPYFYYIFAALPFYLAAFGFHSIVPSMVKYYGKKPAIISKSMLYGSFITFAMYFLWLVSTLGNLQREDFLTVVADGGNIAALINAINHTMASEMLLEILNIFASFAVITSFFGVSISLFDFIADKFNFFDTRLGRFKTALITFVPPSLGGVFYPDGFIYAIGFAGLVLAFNGLIFPAMMAHKSRKIFPTNNFQVWGGNGLLYFMFSMGILYATCHTLAMMELLPVYGR